MVLKLKLLNRLVAAVGISGDESNVRKLIENEIKGHVDEIHIDKHGNLIAHKWGQRPRIMLAAHMDEIGMMVRSIGEGGIINVSSIGGVRPLSMVGQRVYIHAGGKRIRGVATTKKVNDGLDEKALPKMDNIIVDTGLNKAQLEQKGVRVGCRISPISNLTCVGSERYLSGKALDNRIGCFILIELAKRLRKARSDIFYVFTVQEEFGIFGALTSAYKIEPEWGIAIDVTNTDEFSTVPTREMGKGPVLVVKDADSVSNPRINEMIIQEASAADIPLQLEASDEGTTDAFSISVVRGGVPASIICVPIRNVETAASMVDKDDISKTVELIEKILKKTTFNLINEPA